MKLEKDLRLLGAALVCEETAQVFETEAVDVENEMPAYALILREAAAEERQIAEEFRIKALDNIMR